MGCMRNVPRPASPGHMALNHVPVTLSFRSTSIYHRKNQGAFQYQLFYCVIDGQHSMPHRNTSVSARNQTGDRL